MPEREKDPKNPKQSSYLENFIAAAEDPSRTEEEQDAIKRQIADQFLPRVEGPEEAE